eukprot:1200449-Rhodomonas_salina.1
MPSRVTNQILQVDINLEKQSVQATTVLDVLQKRDAREMRLHARQMDIEAVTVNDIPAQWVLENHLDKIVPSGADAYNKQVRDVLNFTLRYKQALEQSDQGELRIWVPRDTQGNATVSPLEPPEVCSQLRRQWSHLR